MKHKILTILSIFLIATQISCDLDEGIQISSNPSSPGIQSPANNASVVLDRDNADQVATTFQWSASDYGFQASITYTLELALAGTNFANVATLATVNNATEASITVGDLNKKVIEIEGEIEEANAVEVRVVADVNDNVESVVSEVLTMSVTTYATSFPPIYMIGAALKGWDPTLAVEMVSYAPNKYKTTAYFTSGEAFRFFAQPDWGPTSYNYPYFDGGSVDAAFENASDGDSNLRMVAETGWYEIDVDLKAKTVVMTSVMEPVMYMTGAGIGGWDTPGTGASIKMTFINPGVFEGTATFVNGEAWRFFAQADWGPTSYNFPYFAEGTVDAMFEDAGDGDNNFRNLAAGTYVVTIDLNTLTVSIAAP